MSSKLAWVVVRCELVFMVVVIVALVCTIIVLLVVVQFEEKHDVDFAQHAWIMAPLLAP